YFEAQLNLGTALGTINRPEEAVQQFKRALELKPKDARIYFNLAMTYEMLERGDEAIASAQTALELARSQGQTALAQQVEAWLNSEPSGQTNGKGGH
ncbi:MAG TPA: tetratricopeptide repeat protein, partial [Pirellulales bacterium]